MQFEFADRLNLVFRAFLRPPDERGRRREWTNGEVAAATAGSGGRATVSRQYLHMLRTGERASPSLETAYAIARAFEHLSRTDSAPGRASGVLAYLAHDPATASDQQAEQVASIDQQLRQAIEIRDGNPLIGLVARLGSLEDPESLESVRRLVDQLEQQETQQRRAARASWRQRPGVNLRRGAG